MRADKEYCSGACRAAVQRAREREPAGELSPEALILSHIYDARQGARQPQLQVDERLSLRARWKAAELALKEIHARAQRQRLPFGESWSTAVVIAEEHAPAVAAKVRALAEPEATHVGFAIIPLGGGKVVLSVVVAAPPGARVLTGSDR